MKRFFLAFVVVGLLITWLPTHAEAQTTLDITAPTHANGPFEITITFSAAVTGFESNDVFVSGGTKSGFSGSGTTYTLNISPSSRSPRVRIIINADVVDGGNPYTTVQWRLTEPHQR